jgi:hypothetical protein
MLQHVEGENPSIMLKGLLKIDSIWKMSSEMRSERNHMGANFFVFQG